MSQDILKQLGLPPFYPLPGLNKGLTQTIAAYYFPYNPFINNSKQHTVSLDDGDKIVLVENSPPHCQANQRTILLIHGLTGSQDSKYLIRATKYFVDKGYRVMRMNLRGCGAGLGLAKHLYHSGRSEDTRQVVKWLAKHYPLSKVTAIGFSLGGNIILKMAGEDRENKSGNLDSVIAISPPLDLEASVKLLMKKPNKVLNDFFVKWLISDTQKLHQLFPSLPAFDIPPIKTVYEFDDYYTAPRCGFINAHDYYTKSSSGQYIKDICLPTLMLYSTDDPVISRRQYLKLPHHDCVQTLITKRGGHVGWIGKTDKFGNYRWMDRLILKWVLQFESSRK